MGQGIVSRLAFMPPEPTYEIHDGHVVWHHDFDIPGDISEKFLMVGREPAFSLSSLLLGGWATSASSTSAAETAPPQIATLHIKHAKNPDNLTILYSHGNAENLGLLRMHMYEICQRLQVNVVGYDYTGYGLTLPRKDPNETDTFLDVEAVLAYLIADEKVEPKRIIAYGCSLGSGPTCEVVRRHPEVGGMVLHSPLRSCVRVVKETYLTLWFDMFANQDKIHQISQPCYIFHGSDDRVIHCSHGMDLSQRAANLWKFWLCKRAGHNDIAQVDPGNYWINLAEFVAHVRSLSAASLPAPPSSK